MIALDGWRQVRLGDVVEDVTVGHVGSMASEYRSEGVPFLRSQNVRPFRLDVDDVKFIDKRFHARLAKSALRDLDVVTVRTGKPGATAVVPPGFGSANCSDLVITRSGPLVDPYWLSYYINSIVDSNVATMLVGAVQQHFNVGAMRSLKVNLPPRSQQRAIADVLGALDDKIAANTKLAATADELVRIEYQALGASVLESVTLGSLAKNVRDLAEPDGSDSLYVGLEHVPRHLMWLTGSGSMADVSSTKARFAEQDVLFGKLRPYFHKVVAAPSSGVCSTDILVLRAVDTELAGFVLAAAASDAVVGAVTASSEGTRMPRASWKDLAACEVPWPGDVVAVEFSLRIAALRDYIQARLRESESLAAGRDALLPALMSGRLTVRDAEATVESAFDGGVEPEALASGTLW